MKISRKGYYSNIDIQFEMIYQLQARETCFIPYDETTMKSKKPIRWLLANYIGMLKKHWNQFKFLEKPMNIYHSMARYENFPMFSYLWNIKAQQQKLWLDKFHEYLVKYDFFLETDSEDDFEEAKRDTIEVEKFLDDMKVRYNLKFSGSKGFHKIIDHDDFSHLGMTLYDIKLEKNMNFKNFVKLFPVTLETLRKISDQVMLFKLISWRINKLFSCDTVDTSVQDVKRVCKVAYSYDVKSELIAYPLTKNQLVNFKKEDYTPEKVLLMNNHKRRLLWRNDDLNIKERQENITNMLRELGIIL